MEVAIAYLVLECSSRDIFLGLPPISHFSQRSCLTQTDLNQHHPHIVNPPEWLLFFITAEEYINNDVFAYHSPLKKKVKLLEGRVLISFVHLYIFCAWASDW